MAACRVNRECSGERKVRGIAGSPVCAAPALLRGGEITDFLRRARSGRSDTRQTRGSRERVDHRKSRCTGRRYELAAR
jgi:hypothetical protein